MFSCVWSLLSFLWVAFPRVLNRARLTNWFREILNRREPISKQSSRHHLHNLSPSDRWIVHANIVGVLRRTCVPRTSPWCATCAFIDHKCLLGGSIVLLLAVRKASEQRAGILVLSWIQWSLHVGTPTKWIAICVLCRSYRCTCTWPLWLKTCSRNLVLREQLRCIRN